MEIFFWRQMIMWQKEISQGPTWGPQPTRACLGVLERQVGCADLVHPPLMLFASKIHKYSEKKHIKISDHSKNFYFWVIFYCTGNSENRQNMAFYFIYLIKIENKKQGQKVVLTKFINFIPPKNDPLIRLIKSY